MTTAKLCMYGRRQAVRLPQGFRFPGKRVRVRRFGLGVLLEPAEIDADIWFEALDCGAEAMMPEGRRQPCTPIGRERRRSPSGAGR